MEHGKMAAVARETEWGAEAKEIFLIGYRGYYGDVENMWWGQREMIGVKPHNH